jgi:sugar lactone lactonase YvrE
MRGFLTALVATLLLAGCGEPPASESLTSDGKSWTIAETSLFPADRSLARPEDGVFLPDGRLIVADLRYGLIELSPDGTATPFGAFAEAGFSNEPGPEQGGPNGVHLSGDGTHILVADVFAGKIYQTDIASGTTKVIYSHSATVNTAISDSTGAVWFTQSTDGIGEERMFAAVDKPMGDGALFRLAANADGSFANSPQLLVDGLDFGNGFYLDEERGKLYLSETMGNRVLQFDLDIEAGTVSNQKVLAEIPTPDNMRMVDDGSLWVASPIANRVFAIDPDTGAVRIAFDAQTAKGAALVEEWLKRGREGSDRLDLLGAEMQGEMPGLLTGMIVDSNNRPIFISGLGDALVRLDR